MKQANLFTGVTGFEEYDEMAQDVKYKRVHYKTPTYVKFYKNDVIDGKIHNNHMLTWGRMRELHILLSNFFLYFLTDKSIEPSIIEEDYNYQYLC